MKGPIYYVAIATVIFSHVKTTCYFHVWRDSCFAPKLTCYFIGVYIINSLIQLSGVLQNKPKKQRFYDTVGQTLFTLLPFAVFVLGDCGQNNRRITFLTPVSGFYLQGHVISNHSVQLNLDFQDQCAFARECVSYNIGPMINNKMTCELGNSDDLQQPKDLKPRKDWIYRGTQLTSTCVDTWSCLTKCPKSW